MESHLKAEPPEAELWAGITEGWPTGFAVKALFGNARFVGDVRIERAGQRITITGRRVRHGLYWLRFWLIAALIAALALPPVQEAGVSVVLNLLSVLVLVTLGGRLLLIGIAQPASVSFMLSESAGPSVGLHVRGWHLLLVGFSGLAALVVFALYRGGRQTVSVRANDGEGSHVRYLFMARDPKQAVQLAALFIP